MLNLLFVGFIDQAAITRLLQYNAQPLYKNITVDFYSRKNKVTTQELFVVQNGKCACGCGQVLPAYKKKWYSKTCSKFAFTVSLIISGNTEIPKAILRNQFVDICYCCGLYSENIALDHIVPVVKGGGACYLNNYQLLCRSCHKKKTALESKERAEYKRAKSFLLKKK